MISINVVVNVLRVVFWFVVVRLAATLLSLWVPWLAFLAIPAGGDPWDYGAVAAMCAYWQLRFRRARRRQEVADVE